LKYPGETGGIILLLSYSPAGARDLVFLIRRRKKVVDQGRCRENETMKKKRKGCRAKKSTLKPSVLARLRESYSQAAEQSLQICKEWEPLDYELWAKLDQLRAHKVGF
jgi:hypothetical protein